MFDRTDLSIAVITLQVPGVKGGDLKKFLQLTAFVILRYFIETDRKATF
jgi:hypothetical protein